METCIFLFPIMRKGVHFVCLKSIAWCKSFCIWMLIFLTLISQSLSRSSQIHGLIIWTCFILYMGFSRCFDLHLTVLWLCHENEFSSYTWQCEHHALCCVNWLFWQLKHITFTYAVEISVECWVSEEYFYGMYVHIKKEPAVLINYCKAY